MANWEEQQGAEHVAELQTGAPWRLRVRNDTTYRLVRPEVDAPPNLVGHVPNIEPNNQATVECQRVPAIPIDSHGTLSWLVKERNQRIIIMWEAPERFGDGQNTTDRGTGLGDVDHGPEDPLWMDRLTVAVSRPGVITNPRDRSWYDIIHGPPQEVDQFLRYMMIRFDRWNVPVPASYGAIETEGQMTVEQGIVHLTVVVRPATGGNQGLTLEEIPDGDN